MSDTTPKGLWAPRSVEETQKLYAEWADTYEKDVREMGYATPGRIASALRDAGADTAAPVLDFGCGTGLSGIALRGAGFEVIDGMDISAEMIAKADAKGAYRQLWQVEPGSMRHVSRGDYRTITATGVVSLGAAPPETLDMLLGALAPGGLLALSYNDATLQDAAYTGKLAEVLADAQADLAFEEHGPHLTAKNMNSTVYVLKTT